MCLIIWIDFMKLGRVTNACLNNVVELAKRALASSPEKAVAFAIAPQLASDRRGGMRAEWRRPVVGVKN